MDKKLFSMIAKKAHVLTKAYRRKFKCDYNAQQAIFFKLLYSMYKASKTKQVALTGKTKQGLTDVFIKAKGIDIDVMIIPKGKIINGNNAKWSNLWNLLDKNTYAAVTIFQSLL